MINNLSMAVLNLAKCILTSVSDETLLPKYVNLSTNFRGPSLKVEMAITPITGVQDMTVNDMMWG